MTNTIEVLKFIRNVGRSLDELNRGSKEFASKYIHAVTPGALIRYLENQGFEGKVKLGSKHRIWNTNFDTPIPKQP